MSTAPSRSDYDAAIREALLEHEDWLKTDRASGSRADLSFRNMRGISLECVRLTNSNLSYCDFSGCDLTNAELEYCELEGADFIGCDMRGAIFDGSNLRHADFTNSDLSGASFKDADLHGANLETATRRENDLRGAINVLPLIQTKKKKNLVLLCEDMWMYRKRFRKRHEEEFEIRECPSPADLLPTVQKLFKSGRKPHLVVIDLFWPKNQNNVINSRKEVNAVLDEFNDVRRKVEKVVGEHLHPEGVNALQELRRHFPSDKLPILISTRLGPFLLSDIELDAIYNNKSGFLLKHFSENVERRRIRTFIQEHILNWWQRRPRDHWWQIIYLVVGAIFSQLLTVLWGLI